MTGEESFLTGEDARLKIECLSRCVTHKCVAVKSCTANSIPAQETDTISTFGRPLRYLVHYSAKRMARSILNMPTVH